MTAKNKSHIFFSSVVLFCVALGFAGILKFMKVADTTWADELSMGTGVALALGCVASCLALRDGPSAEMWEKLSDCLFLCSMFSLLAAMAGFAYNWF